LPLHAVPELAATGGIREPILSTASGGLSPSSDGQVFDVGAAYAHGAASPGEVMAWRFSPM